MDGNFSYHNTDTTPDQSIDRTDNRLYGSDSFVSCTPPHEGGGLSIGAILTILGLGFAALVVLVLLLDARDRNMDDAVNGLRTECFMPEQGMSRGEFEIALGDVLNQRATDDGGLDVAFPEGNVTFDRQGNAKHWALMGDQIC